MIDGKSHVKGLPLMAVSLSLDAWDFKTFKGVPAVEAVHAMLLWRTRVGKARFSESVYRLR